MTIDPTREEWLAARERLPSVHLWGGEPARDAMAEAVLGPCPPEPPPPWWQRDGGASLAVAPQGDRVWVGFPFPQDHEMLTPDEADRMADALRDHARYAREQGAASDA